jgi:large subunit ribosomal protein LP0
VVLYAITNTLTYTSVHPHTQVPAAARAGAVSPVEVIIPAGSTGLDPGQTAFFQVLNIGTKIARGSIEVRNTVCVCACGCGCDSVVLTVCLSVCVSF